MANVLEVKKLARKNDQATGTFNTTQGIVLLSGTETWRVRFDGVTDQFSVTNAAGLPQIGDQADTIPNYSGGSSNSTTLVVQRVEAIRHSDNYCVWDVRVDIADTAAPLGPYNIQINRGHQGFEQQKWADRLSLPLTNTVNDLLPQLPTATYSDETISISYTLTTGTSRADVPNIGVIDSIVQKQKVNSDNVAFTINGRAYSFTARQLKLTAAPIRSSKSVAGNDAGTGMPVYSFQHNVELQFLVRTDGFHFHAANEGFRGFPLASNIANYPAGASTTTIVTFSDGPPTGPIPRPNPTKLDPTGMEVPQDSTGINSIYFLPDCISGSATGRFDLEDQTAYSGLFAWSTAGHTYTLRDP